MGSVCSTLSEASDTNNQRDDITTSAPLDHNAVTTFATSSPPLSMTPTRASLRQVSSPIGYSYPIRGGAAERQENPTWMTSNTQPSANSSSHRNQNNATAAHPSPAETQHYVPHIADRVGSLQSPLSIGTLMPLPMHCVPASTTSAPLLDSPALMGETALADDIVVNDLTTSDGQRGAAVTSDKKVEVERLAAPRRSFGDAAPADGRDASLTMCFDQQLHSPTIAAEQQQSSAKVHKVTIVRAPPSQLVDAPRRLTLMGSATASTSSTLQPLWADSSSEDVQNPLALPKLDGGKRSSVPTAASMSVASLQAFAHARSASHESADPAAFFGLHPSSLSSTVLTPKSGAVAPGAAWKPSMNAAGFSMDSYAIGYHNNAVGTSMASSQQAAFSVTSFGFGTSHSVSAAPMLIHCAEDAEWHLPNFRKQ